MVLLINTAPSDRCSRQGRATQPLQRFTLAAHQTADGTGKLQRTQLNRKGVRIARGEGEKGKDTTRASFETNPRRRMTAGRSSETIPRWTMTTTCLKETMPSSLESHSRSSDSSSCRCGERSKVAALRRLGMEPVGFRGREAARSLAAPSRAARPPFPGKGRPLDGSIRKRNAFAAGEGRCDRRAVTNRSPLRSIS